MKAIVVGASGLIGAQVVQIAAREKLYGSIVAPARRKIGVPDGVENPIVDFDKLESAHWKADHIFCCIGTTIKVAGSQEAFRRVDYDIAVNTAALARSNGASKIFVVSALGADKKSGIFYSKVKGEMEAAIIEMGFAETWIFRPSLLTGERKDSRPGEVLGQIVGSIFSPLFIGGIKKYKPIAGEVVARAMLCAAFLSRPGVNIVESDQIQELGKAG
ncbi:MAG: NAD(P)H-binding protein [Spirochaetia bacterium]|nr:NAD(P)H-binding protein [Spirochaetia bacterium]